MRAFWLTFLALPSAASAQEVVVTGECPGDVVVTASGLTPNESAWLAVGGALGNYALPGTACEGTNMGIDSPLFYGRILADATGTSVLNRTVTSDQCDYLVVTLDPATCGVSAPATLPGGSNRNVTFQVDMSCAPAHSVVYVTGPWTSGPGWDDSYPMADTDGDGIHTLTVAFAAGTEVEYKYMVDNWADQEDLIDDMVAGSSCAPITDYFSYANRWLVANEDTVTNDVYGTCSDCDSQPVDVSFEVDMSCSGLTPDSVALPGPDVAWDFWSRPLTDADGDNIWTGTFSFLPGSTVEYTIALDNWAMQEDLIDDMIAGGSCAPVTDYFSYANRQVIASDGLKVSDTYDQCESCP